MSMMMYKQFLLILLSVTTIPTALCRSPSYSNLNLVGFRPSVGGGGLANANSLLRQATRRRSSLMQTATRRREFHHMFYRSPSSTRRYMLDFFDPLEPFELAWELYCKRYEILDELVVKLVTVTKRNSVRALTAIAGACVFAEVFARVGIIGNRGEGLATYVSHSERWGEGGRERVFQKTSTFFVDRGIDVLAQFRRFGGKSKFAISVGAGVFFGQAVITTTVTMVRAVLVSFFFIETLSFLGVIGDLGESILDWVEDEREKHAGWTVKMARMHKGARKRMSFEWLEELYEAAVDEEKIASFGFSVGTVFSLLT